MPDQQLITNLLTVAGFIVMVTLYIVNSRTSNRILSERFSYLDKRVAEFSLEMKKMNEIIVTQAVQNSRIGNMDERLLAQGKRLDNQDLTMNQILIKLAMPPPSRTQLPQD